MRRLRAHQRACYWAAVVAVLVGAVWLRSPALHGALFSDDWDHYAIEQGIYPVKLPIWDMFNWVGSTASERAALLHSGRLPWWAGDDVHLAVFRPLASLLVHFDYAVLGGPDHPERLLLHSLAFWLLLLLGVAALFECLLPLPIAALGVLIYALDDAHIVPFGWIANRSEIIAFAFMVWALWAYVLAERRRSRGLWLLSIALTCLGFASGEHALAPLAFLVAAWLYEAGPLRQRLLRIAPFAVVVAAYVLIRARLGYGIAGSGFYIDPLTDPQRFAKFALVRIPVLLGDLVFSAASEWWYWSFPLQHTPWFRDVVPKVVWTLPVVRPIMIVIGVIAGLVSIGALLWLRRTRRRLAAGGQPELHLEWLLVGALASLVPLSGTITLGRMVVSPAIAFDALAAYVSWHAARTLLETSRRWRRIWLGSALLAIGVIMLYLPANRSRDGAHFLNGISHTERRWIEDADFGVDSLAGRHVIVLSSRDLASQFFIPYILHAAHRPMPASARMLGPVVESPQRLTRIGSGILDLEYPTLEVRTPPFNGCVYRTEDDAFHVGDYAKSDLFDVFIMKMQDGQPRHLRFIFHMSLDDPRLVFMNPTRQRLKRFTLPAPGQTVELPPAEGP